MSVSCGAVWSDELQWESVREIAKLADQRMYEKKAELMRDGERFPELDV